MDTLRPAGTCRRSPGMAGRGTPSRAHQKLNTPGDAAVDAEERAGAQRAEHSLNTAIGRVNPGRRELAGPVVAVGRAMEVGGGQRAGLRAAGGEQLVPDRARAARWPDPSDRPAGARPPYAPRGVWFWWPGAPSTPRRSASADLREPFDFRAHRGQVLARCGLGDSGT